MLAHWPSPAQAVRQADPEHAYPLHEDVVAAAQAPLPSHLRAAVTVPSVQLAAAQTTDVAANTQEVAVPSQALPQVPGTQPARPPRGDWPAASVVQWPVDPARSQAWQEPPQAESQQ